MQCVCGGGGYRERTFLTVRVYAVQCGWRDDGDLTLTQRTFGGQLLLTGSVDLQTNRCYMLHASSPTERIVGLSESDPHHGLTPQTLPVLQPEDAATSLITNAAFSRDGQVPLQPLVRHRHLSSTGKMSEEAELQWECLACVGLTPSSSSMMSFPMEARVVHLQLLVARTAQRL